eukprot:scaffold11328_cov66-Cyclotella_meneghiniana.AAC.10
MRLTRHKKNDFPRIFTPSSKFGKVARRAPRPKKPSIDECEDDLFIGMRRFRHAVRSKGRLVERLRSKGKAVDAMHVGPFIPKKSF